MCNGGPAPCAKGLPDVYASVADDVLKRCRPSEGVWVDLGSGSGGLGLALAARAPSALILLDANAEAFREGLRAARDKKMHDRVAAVAGLAERMPLRDESVELVVSRGSIFFWRDRPAGLREVYRILRPGGEAMIGGGLGARYPQWARQEFVRRRRAGVERRGPRARRSFDEARSHDTFRGWACQAELPRFTVEADQGFPTDNSYTELGIWLRFGKEIARGKHH